MTKITNINIHLILFKVKLLNNVNRLYLLFKVLKQNQVISLKKQNKSPRLS